MKVSPLHSAYIIDGVQMDNTPAQMLDDCSQEKASGQAEGSPALQPVVDETVDPAPNHTSYAPGKVMEYLERIRKYSDKAASPARCQFPGSYTRRQIAASLLSSIWKKGHFGLNDLELEAAWNWDSVPMGNMAAFYYSVEAASQYIFDLGINLKGYSYSEREGRSSANFTTVSTGKRADKSRDDYDFLSDHYDDVNETSYCWISEERKCGAQLLPDRDSWLIYIPFDTCPYRLGGSALERLEGCSGETAPEVQDPDYFIDCFEVVRELIEDGVVIAGTSVDGGGLAAAAAGMCTEETGTGIDISRIESSYMEKDILRILFSEVPGVLIQIRDADYDYIDAQFLLQEIAYYPLGHPDLSGKGLSIIHGKRPGVSDILASLIEGQFSEGED